MKKILLWGLFLCVATEVSAVKLRNMTDEEILFSVLPQGGNKENARVFSVKAQDIVEHSILGLLKMMQGLSPRQEKGQYPLAVSVSYKEKLETRWVATQVPLIGQSTNLNSIDQLTLIFDGEKISFEPFLSLLGAS